MSLKKTILSVLSRDTLKALVDAFEIDAADRRSVDAMRSALSKSRKATPAAILECLSADEVREVAEESGLGSKGTKAALVAELLAETEPREEGPSADERSEEPEARTERVRPLPEVPPGMLRVTRTELVWPGKYDDDGRLREAPRVSLPFQVIERVNESRASREAEKAKLNLSLFDTYEGKEGETFEDGWRNKLIWGDNQLVMNSLLEKFAGRIDLIYIDPPFMMGSDFSVDVPIGEDGLELTKEQSAVEEHAYRDTWGGGLASYLSMMGARLRLMRDLLVTEGNFVIHLDATVVHYVKVLLDDLLGVGGKNGVPGWRSEIIWFHNVLGTGTRVFPKTHETLLWYSRGAEWIIDPTSEHVRVPYSDRITKTLQKDEKGWYYVRGNRDTSGNVTGKWFRTYVDPEEIEKGKFASDVWEDIKSYRAQGEQATGYPTQKPEKLLYRVIDSLSRPHALVADFFCGSGTTLAVAEKLGRRWIGCDLGRYAIHVTRKRLLDIEGCKPFEILNLGKYERRYWQVATFGDDLDGDGQIALYEYLAFVLKLYGAQPVSGLEHLHGKKGRAMVHVAAVDAPVTISEVNAALEECLRVKQPELHVLGWEWEMGLNDLMTDEAKKQGVKLLLLQIPREVMEKQAADKGDVTFFELAYLDAEISASKKLTATVALREFVIPNSDLIPEDVHQKIRRWSDYIDYWAVDWDFRNDTFMQGWVTYRTRKDRTLELKSDPHTYPKAGSYTVMVKVVDIFGNDTSRTFRVEVR